MATGAWQVYGFSTFAIMGSGIPPIAPWRVALLGAGYVPNRAAHASWSDVSAHELAATGNYAAGGKAFADANTRTGDFVTVMDGPDLTWANLTGAPKYAVIVAAGVVPPGATDTLLCYCDLNVGGGALSLTAQDLALVIAPDGVLGLYA